MRVEFPFVEEKANIIPSIFRPIARVTLIKESNSITQDMYADSGADITLIPYSVGIALGFELKPDEEIKHIGGVGGGRISVVLREVKIKITEKVFSARIAWCLSEDVPLILGRLDVFDHFKVIFDQKNMVTIFEY